MQNSLFHQLIRRSGYWFVAPMLAICWVTEFSLFAEDEESVVQPNYRQAAQYSSQYVRQFLYDTTVTPRFIGETDRFWYSFRNSTGTHYYLVDPARKTKEPLFDAVKLSSQLSELTRKPLDPSQLSLSRVEMDDDGESFKFVADDVQWEYTLESETLVKLGDPPRQTNQGFRGRGNLTQQQIQQLNRLRQQQAGGSNNGQPDPNAHRVYSDDRTAYVFAKGHNLFLVEVPEDAPLMEDEEEASEEEGGEEDADGEETDSETDETDDGDEVDDSDETVTEEEVTEEEVTDEEVTDEETVTEQTDTDEENSDEQTDEQDTDEQDTDNEDTDNEDTDEDTDEEDEDTDEEDAESTEDGEEAEEEELPIPRLAPEVDDHAIQITDDGVEDYSFAGRPPRGRNGSRQETPITDDQKTRPSVSWSDDSKSFYVTRRDSRDVQELWVINSLAEPRPTLESYDYPMPGEEHIRTSELHTYSRGAAAVDRVDPKWVDESYTSVHWSEEGTTLRFLRRDRLLRNIEFCEIDMTSGELTVLLEEGFENAHIAPQGARYLEKTDEMIWWSERSGWGHFYLYGRDGELKNAITSGQFRASSIVDVDEDNRLLYFQGNGREEGENIYLNHLYCVRFDGSGLMLMDPGNADHRSTLSPSKQFVVDNCSRVDMPPVSLLRNAAGETVMELEQADMSRLAEIGWQCPSTFVVKAADGVTDLYGNMWKPFDFDPNKQYPIIAHVYPGPQTEGTTHRFTATAGEQQLAQLGFIVIQVGHRGGAPTRSKAYGSFGYLNLRDYGLADKKAAIEQLAQRFSYIDVERVGIYGHSGGGFMTAAALMQEPYNDFFKVGVSTAGNHDNNIYNNSWSERYHGLKQVEEEVESNEGRRGGGRGGRGRGGRGNTEQEDSESSNNRNDGAIGGSQAADYFYEYEIIGDDAIDELDRWHDQAWWNEMIEPPIFSPQDGQDQTGTQDGERRGNSRRGGRGNRGNREQQDTDTDNQDDEQQQQEDGDTEDGDTDDGDTEDGDTEDGDTEEDGDEDVDEDDVDEDDGDDEDGDEEDSTESEQRVRFEIEVPTNAELAENLKGHLFLIHGELDNNVHPANTLRLVDALIKANKRFDMLYLPATRHGFGEYQPYVTQRMFEYFAEHLLDDYQESADIGEKE